MNFNRGVAGVCLALIVAVGATHAADNPEVEPNDDKAGATLANSSGGGLVTGDTISGTTTGTSTTVAGPASADNFLVTTAAMPAGVYRHRLILTSSPAGHTLTIRGLTQTGGAINVGSDATIQTGSTQFPGAPAGARVIQWYGFGKQERIFVRVTGSAMTTAPYSAVLETSAITPAAMSDGVEAGDVLVKPDAATAAAIDTDWWMYDPAFNAIPGFGHDDPDESGITRAMSAGTHTIALGRYNTCNNQGSPVDDTFRGGPVLDFADALVNASITTTAGMTMRADSIGSSATGDSSTDTPFGIGFFSLLVRQVVTPTNPICGMSMTPASVDAGGSTLITVTVTPGQNPDTSPHTVVADLSAIGDSASAVFVEGPANTFTYLATVAACLPAGEYGLTATVAEIAPPGRGSACSRSLMVGAGGAGACCFPAVRRCLITTACDCDARGGSYMGDGSACDRTADEPIYSADTFPIAIPDHVGTVPGVAISTISISNGQTVDALDVCIGLTHTFSADLMIELSNGVHTARLSDRQGGGSDLDGTYCFSDGASTAWIPAGDPVPPGTYTPFETLAVFAGDSYDGTWTLTVSDNASIDVGTIGSFGIIPVTIGPACWSCPPCPADYSQDGSVDGRDVEAFFIDWESAEGCADTNQDGGIDGGDVEFFFVAWESGGC